MLKQWSKAEDARLAAEGYRFYLQEAGEFAVASMPAVSKALDQPIGAEPEEKDK